MAVNETTGYYGLEIIWDALKLAIKELIEYLPSIFLALTLIAIYIAIALIINNILRKVFKLLRVDELIRPLTKQLYLSLTNLVILLVDLGLALLAIYSIILILLPSYIEYASLFLNYVGRIASIVFVIIIAFISLNVIVGYIRLETKLRGFMFLILLFVTLILIIDITTLSAEVRTALAWGIGIGISLMIAIFSIWYFFHDIIERKYSETSK